MPDRDRDDEGRARNARPRDGLGRPLPYGTPGVERQSEGVVRTPAQSLVEAQQLIDEGKPFHAHEVFEDAWKSTDHPAEQQLWKGLAQLAVGVTHLARGNRTGAARLLCRGRDNIADYVAAPPYGIAVADLVGWASELADRLETAPDEVAAAMPDVPRLSAGAHHCGADGGRSPA